MKKVGPAMAATLGFILLWAHLAHSSQPLSSYNLLQNVAVDRKDGELLIQLKFKNPPVHFQGPKFFKKSIQIDFPLAYVNPPKRYFDTGDDRIRQVYVSQFDRKRLRLRLMLASGASVPKDETVVEQVGRVLQIRIQSSSPKPAPVKNKMVDPLESLLARASRIQQSKVVQTKTTSGQLAKTSSAEKTLKASSPVEKVRSVSPEKSADPSGPLLSQVLGRGLQSEPAASAASEQASLKTRKAGILELGNDLSSEDSGLFSASLKMASTLGLVLGLMFIVFHLFKKFGLKNSVFGGEGKPIKVLSTGFLAPRKSIALVEVAGDILVVGISNDQISLLGNIQDPEKIEQIKGALHKKDHDQKPSAAAPESKSEAVEAQAVKEEMPQASKQGVDVYNKRLIKSGSTNPFGEYVKQFTDSSETEQQSMKDVASRVKKKLEEVPIFK